MYSTSRQSIISVQQLRTPISLCNSTYGIEKIVEDFQPMISIINGMSVITVVGLKYSGVLRIDDRKRTLEVQISFTVDLLSSVGQKSACVSQDNHSYDILVALRVHSVFTFQRLPRGISGGSTPPSIDRSMGVVPFGMFVRRT